MNKLMRAMVLTVVVSVSLLGPALPAAGQEADPSYKRTDYPVRDLAPGLRPYASNGAGALDGNGTYDEQGVSVRIISGKAYDHPVLQAQFMLTRLSSYGYNRDPEYLARVKAHGDRLIANSITSRGAMYLPYPFDWALHGDKTDMMTAPWYSAMAQGQALSAFVRLYKVTMIPKYKDAADALFASFSNLKADGVPWTVNVDGQGFLWFEEYAKDVGADRSFNGHVYATYGLYDYYKLTGSARAKALFQGGVTAVEGHMPEIRNAGWISRYSLANTEYLYANYHKVHVGQLFQLYNLTGAAALAEWGDRMLEDYPSAQHGGRGYLEKGKHEGVKATASGPVTSTQSFDLPAAQAVTFTNRQRLQDQPGVWLLANTGTLAGHWVRETPDRSYVKLGTETFTFNPVRLVRFAKGTYTGYKFNTLGLRSSSKRIALTAASGAHSDQRTVMNGVTYYRITSGLWAGYSMPVQNGVSVH